LTIDIRVNVLARGPDQLVYFMQHFTETDVLTNLENGRSFRSVVKAIPARAHRLS
jgi:hypothetical protein